MWYLLQLSSPGFRDAARSTICYKCCCHGFGDMNEYFFWRMADYYCEWLMGASKRNEVDIKEMNND